MLSGDQLILRTSLPWPSQQTSSCRVAVLQRRMVLSLEAVANQRTVGRNGDILNLRAVLAVKRS